MEEREFSVISPSQLVKKRGKQTYSPLSIQIRSGDSYWLGAADRSELASLAYQASPVYCGRACAGPRTQSVDQFPTTPAGSFRGTIKQNLIFLINIFQFIPRFPSFYPSLSLFSFLLKIIHKCLGRYKHHNEPNYIPMTQKYQQ